MRVVALAAGLPALASALLSRSVSGVQNGLSPVTRVVEILQGLSQKIEDEQKTEEGLFTTYLCWGKSVVSQKEASNAAAQARIDELTQYIADLDAGRIELTTERVDLQKEIAGLTADIEQATALRNQENKDYLAAKAEMEQAVDALTRALQVLRAGQPAALFSVASHVESETFSARKADSDLLDKAVSLGARFLSKGDAVFLRRVLDGDVPTKDWKKLNRKATFKKKYTARSEKIEALMQKMLEDFSADLQESKTKEEAAVQLHSKLMTTKGGQKTTAETALSSLDKEGGARSLSKTDAQAEKTALGTQITDDTGFITSTKSAMDTKKTDWDKRKQIRQGELAAIAEAISVLHSDDSRDLFKRSFGSQGYLFLQEASAVVAGGQRGRNAAEVLRQTAKRTGDRRLAGLSILAAKTHFDAVIGHIDSMLSDLRTEESEELTKKETCETDRSTDTRTAIVTSREIDEFSDAITSLEAKIKEIEVQVTEKEEEQTKITEQLTKMAEIRQRETQDYLVAKKDDEDAGDVVEKAKGVLETFYQNIALVQGHAKAGAPVETVAGEAPPPPPPTWTADYKGSTGESQGIIAILGMIKSDIDADLAAAKKAEADAQNAYITAKGDLEGEHTALGTQITTLNGEKATHEGDITTNKGDRSSKKTDLKATLKKIKDAEAYCDWMLINFAARASNRQVEIDGLEKAKAILSGADFGFLQRRK